MVPVVTFSVDTTLTDARVLAHVINTGLRVWTVAIGKTFATSTPGYWVANVTSLTETNRTFFGRVPGFEAWFTVGVGPARVWFAQITSFKRSAPHKRITGHVFGTGADWSKASKVTVCARTTNTIARVLANAVKTGRTTWRTVNVPVTLRLARNRRISKIVFRARTDSLVVPDGTVGAFTTLGAARVLATEIDASLVGVALGIAFALVTTTGNWGTQKSWSTFAGWYIVDYFTKCISTARTGITKFRRIKPSTTTERISSISRWTATNWHVISGLTVGVNTTRA